jgi:hypothetical protein
VEQSLRDALEKAKQDVAIATDRLRFAAHRSHFMDASREAAAAEASAIEVSKLTSEVKAAKLKLDAIQSDYDKAKAAVVVTLKSGVHFEAKGVDVVISAGHGKVGSLFLEYAAPIIASVELKPEIGDDFPSIMRQMARLRADVLVTYNYNGRGATEAQMRAMFNASGIRVVFVHEIETAMEGQQ